MEASEQQQQQQQQQLSPGTDVVFCGNPGAGKSTLLSCISGVVFEAGLSYGEGLTSRLEMKESPQWPGVRFADTPGLADLKMAEQAVQAIAQAFRDAVARGRCVKIFFVVTTEAGRIQQFDIFTIKQVMESIVMPDGSLPGPNSYCVIINKCDFLDRPDFETRGKAVFSNLLGTTSESVPFATSWIQYVPLVPEMSNATNQMADCPSLAAVVRFFPGLPSIGGAREIDVSSLEERMAKLAKQYADNAEAVERTLRDGHQEELAALQRRRDATMADMQARLAEAEAAQQQRSSESGDFWRGLLEAVPPLVVGVIRQVMAERHHGTLPSMQQQPYQHLHQAPQQRSQQQIPFVAELLQGGLRPDGLRAQPQHQQRQYPPVQAPVQQQGTGIDMGIDMGEVLQLLASLANRVAPLLMRATSSSLR